MNDTTRKQLKTIVERAVRPLVVNVDRKRQMREELLAHLTAVYDEEFARLNDEGAALAKTAERFGDPRAITDDLRKTIGRRNRAGAWFERVNLHPDDAPRLMFIKLAGMTLATFVTTQLALLPSLWLQRKGTSLGTMTYTALMVSLFSGVFCSFLFVGANQIRRAVYGDAERGLPPTRSWRRAMPTILASLAFFPAFGFGFYWLLVGDLAASLHNFWVACSFAWLAPILFVTSASKMAEQVRYEQEWAALEADA